MAEEKILFICDDPYRFEKYANVLRHEGFGNVIAVKDTTEGLRVAAENNPDLILLEWGTSQKHNYAFLDAIRERGITARLVILGVSTEWSSDLSRFVQAGVSDYVAKVESTGPELADTIRRVLTPKASSLTSSTPMTEKLLSRLGELEDLNQRLREHPANRDDFGLCQPGDFVYFVEGRLMAFCCIDKIVKTKSNPQFTEYVLEIVRQPRNNEFFRPVYSLRRHFTVGRAPGAEGVSGMWRFYTPKEFEYYYSHFRGDMVTWSEYFRSYIYVLIAVLIVFFLVIGGCLLATRLFSP